jgi:23S rRNA A1618 N6-methylase RlmF
MNGDNGGNSKRKRHEREDVSFESLVTPNFEELARRFPDFGRAWKVVHYAQIESGGSFGSHVTQDFSIALTRALLHIHWGLTLNHLPLHHLCPPIPNRYFYVKWIQGNLLPLLTSANYFQPIRFMQQTGLDIGTGATAIYPLLFVSSANQPYRIFAADVDADSVELAKENILDNRLLTSIQLHQVTPTDRQQQGQQLDGIGGENMSDPQQDHDTIPVGPLRRSLEHLGPARGSVTALDFCMTNPPFYDDTVDSTRIDPRAGDQRKRTAMTVSEGSYPGGEVGFVVDMIVDTLVLFARCQSAPGWSSCMCGKKTSLVHLQNIVTALLGPGHCQVTEFGPGHLTRWFLAWTMERPQIRSPLAKVEHGMEFNVDFGDLVSMDETNCCVERVTGRIQDYCRTLPGWELAVDVTAASISSMGRGPNGSSTTGQQWLQILENEPSRDSWNEDDAFPAVIQRALGLLDPDRRMQLLPPQGHFLLDVTLTPQGLTVVQVQVTVYQHSAYGKKAVDKIKSQLQAEICRTSRRWRRKLQREREEQSVMQE